MDLNLKEKVAVVTGGSKGIGFYTALQLVKEGAKVAIVARNKQNLEGAADIIKEQTGESVFIISADVTKQDECTRIINETVNYYGKLDILVNNAGQSATLSFEEVDADLWQSDLDLKLFGAINCSKAAVPYLKQKGGSIINLSAVLAKTPPATSLPTTVSRAAGLALTKAMSRDLGKYNIRVNAVCIGLVRSEQVDRLWREKMPDLTWDEYSKEIGKTIPLGRVGNTEEAAKVITFLASDAASYVTGTSVNIDGGSGGTL
ncbi:SDR family oxidoreductase [Lysinibacillus yapensis]|uniref:SDR family oxidoreductase n=1 Tax=Ureibacillus yapensis TaxID=2304605 RepID=A0A396SB39_9BACL|nr:SDR family oxidoreductase [Lysinibacillus yapensis]RHW38313.1 SDR family oxidoreductase [Lysinibacillus yapensis]